MHAPHHHPPIEREQERTKTTRRKCEKNAASQHRKKEEHTNALHIQRKHVRLNPLASARRSGGHPRVAKDERITHRVQARKALIRGHRTPAHGGHHRAHCARQGGDTHAHPLSIPHPPSLIPGRQGPKTAGAGRNPSCERLRPARFYVQKQVQVI